MSLESFAGDFCFRNICTGDHGGYGFCEIWKYDMALRCVDSFSLEDTGVLAFNSNFSSSLLLQTSSSPSLCSEG